MRKLLLIALFAAILSLSFLSLASAYDGYYYPSHYGSYGSSYYPSNSYSETTYERVTVTERQTVRNYMPYYPHYNDYYYSPNRYAPVYKYTYPSYSNYRYDRIYTYDYNLNYNQPYYYAPRYDSNLGYYNWRY